MDSPVASPDQSPREQCQLDSARASGRREACCTLSPCSSSPSASTERWASVTLTSPAGLGEEMLASQVGGLELDPQKPCKMHALAILGLRR